MATLAIDVAGSKLAGRRLDNMTPRERCVLRTIGTEPELIDGTAYRNSNIVLFDGKSYIFSHRAILTLVTSAACNAACKFCSNEVTFTPSGPYLRVNDSLKRVKDFALVSGVTKVAFTGGEPTANPERLYQLVAAIMPGFRRGRLHKNGFGLFKTVHTNDLGDVDLLPALISAGLTGASVSVAHHDSVVNAVVMRFKGTWKGLDNDALRLIGSHRSKQFSPRLSCVLTHESVHDLEGMRRYIDWGLELGFRKFIFRSCSGIPEIYRRSTDYAVFNAANYIPIDPITKLIDSDGSFEQTFEQHKSDSHVHVYRYLDSATVDIDESSEEADPDPKVRRLNVMPNGVAYTSWIDPTSVLFDDDFPKTQSISLQNMTVRA